MRSVCICLHPVEVCTYLYMMWGGLAGNVNSVIEGIYLGISCGLTQPEGILGAGGVYYRGVSCENFESCECITSW